MTRTEKAERVWQLRKILSVRADHYRKKADRAKSDKMSVHWELRAIMLNKHLSRTCWLSENLLNKDRKFGKTNLYLIAYEMKWYKEGVERRIARGKERKAKLENSHTFEPWFMSESLTADYGTFTCDKCGRTFYHSPSKIWKAKTVVYSCCCGHCTNEIISQDHKTRPFQ